jgi:hypothetical protein
MIEADWCRIMMEKLLSGMSVDRTRKSSELDVCRNVH